MADKDDDNLLSRGREAFERVQTSEGDNRQRFIDDTRFARAGKQWPEQIERERNQDGRPCLTINKMPAFIRQVVNDARQNKPQIRVQPVDSKADPETAEVINGLIRHIEVSSNSDIAYDTAVENAVGGGFGYFRIKTDYAYDDSFDLDILIERIANSLSVYGDPDSTSADGSDWNSAFIVDRMSKDQFKATYGDKAAVDWDDTAWQQASDWIDGDQVMVAEWWVREEVERDIILMSDGNIYGADQVEKDEDLALALAMGELTEVERRKTKSFKVTQHIMTGAEVLESNEWPGRYIPIVPVYGDEYFEDGKRQLKSLVHDAVDAQRMFNYWRTNATEMVALAPRVPYIGPETAFTAEPEKWATANTRNHSFIAYDDDAPAAPQRQPMDTGAAAGSMQEALNAADDMKAIMGLHDASLGARSNETSGRAIMARQREGDVSTFHFIDNLSRSIRQGGKIIIDLIPHVYNKPRMLRILGEDGRPQSTQVNQPVPVMGPNGQPQMDELGQTLTRIHNLTIGKYDLVVSTGPSFTTRREEAAQLMMEFARAYPPAAPLLMDLVARNLDWPGADELAERLQAMLPPPAQGGPPPQLMQAMQELESRVQQLTQENAQLKDKNEIEWQKAETQAYDAETKRMDVTGNLTAETIRLANDRFDMMRQPVAAPAPSPAARPQVPQTPR